MFIRNHEGKLVNLDITKYNNEKDLYCALWKIKFNIDIVENINFNREILSIIRS